ncbi:PATELLIN-1 [Salix purpurea]|uniref:PATELLIN-1 n=1 Tax=Salix purpurea TaxID=77065 RepID=A0A9Q0W5M6_SALPP|nr:PATELLIN-1 [Salix purpurea]
MAEETQKAATPEAQTSATTTEEVVAAEEKPAVIEKETPAPVPAPEPVASEKPAVVEEADAVGEGAVEEEKPKEETTGEVKITQSVSFKEETNVVGELPEAQKKALDDLKQLIQEALKKHEFTTPSPPTPKEEEEKKPAETEKVEVKEAEKTEAPSTSEEPKTEEEPKATEAETEASTPPPPPPVVEEKVEVKEEKVEEKVEEKEEEKKAEPSAAAETVVAAATEVEKVAAVDEDGAKTVEAIEETIVAVSAPTTEEAAPAAEPETAPAEEPKKEEEAAPDAPPPPPEEVFIWGIPLLGDERSDVILLKFLRARDFKVKDAFTMIKNTVKWRKEFGIDALLEEALGTELENVVFTHGVDKEGHPVCYNVYGAFQDKELYQNCFASEEKRAKFLKWRIQFLEKSIRKLDFSPSGICTIVQVSDLKNSPGPAKSGLRQATNQALSLLQDNYPEFVAKNVFINVPWWYLTFNKMISPFLTQRTKSKFVFAGLSKSTETLFKYIAPEEVPVQYGGLSRDGEFTVADSATDVTIKPASKHTVVFPVSEACILAWELRVLGWDVSYEAEFVPSTEDGYTVIVSKTRKVTATDEPVISDTFKIGEPGKVVFTIDNQTSKKKKLLYRSKTKPISE